MKLSMIVLPVLVFAFCFRCHAVDPMQIEDTDGYRAQIIGLDRKAKIVKVSTITPKAQTFALTVTQNTLIGIQSEISSSKLQVGDKILWLSHTYYTIATGKERKRISRVYGKTSPNDFYPKGARISFTFSILNDYKKLATVISLKPLKISMFDKGKRAFWSLDYPLNDKEYPTLNWSTVAVFTQRSFANAKDYSNPSKPQRVLHFLYNSEKNATFCIFRSAKFSDLQSGQIVRVASFLSSTGQHQAISVVSTPLP